MIRHLLIFVITAALGALVALVVRSAFHQPYAAPADSHEHPAATAPAADKTPTKPANDPHAGHASTPAAKPVNDICAICGMDADPKLTAIYQEKVIAFGCAKCPPKFAKDPERFGPYFLRNQEAP
ncbi:MAG: hypothetical protein H0W78_07115 [Planctomycetes bacterium]|jgi:hypothetical protein|nr:hypothetical protein [Planctomycetota bacterium]